MQMHRFAQLHILTVYGPSNLNRDDVGRPKSCYVGGTERLRVSSQAIKRAVRTSEPLRNLGEDHLGVRTRRFGDTIERHLLLRGATNDAALRIARKVAAIFGKVSDSPEDEEEEEDDNNKKPKKKATEPTDARLRQLCFIGPQERQLALSMAEAMLKGDVTEADPKRVLRTVDTAVDVAAFGRMLADAKAYNRDAAVQISHAVTTHKALVESDFYTAVDDLNSGAGFLGEAGFGSGVFYTYVAIDRALLVENLGGDADLAGRGLRAVIEALATVSPSGKQASFASRARASFVLAEVGSQQPRSLISAFQRAVAGEDILVESIRRLLDVRTRMDAAYGACSDAHAMLDVPGGTGTLAAVQDLAVGGVG